jgi:hypothetical protein
VAGGPERSASAGEHPGAGVADHDTVETVIEVPAAGKTVRQYGKEGGVKRREQGAGNRMMSEPMASTECSGPGAK